MKRLRKTKPCNSDKCVHRYVELGTTGDICSSCYECLKAFIEKTERERANSPYYG